MENQKFCQSCAMPLTDDETFGTNADGSKNEEYCVYCYKDGAFTSDCTMEEMIDFCAAHVDEWSMEVSKEEAIAQMKGYFPQLKRWANS